MRLRYTVNSPFARKVRVLAHELGLSGQIELVATSLRTDDPAFWSDNPVAKVPLLVTDDGQKLADSNVICEYLDTVHGAGRIWPASGAARWQALSLLALADAVVEAGILARSEMTRPASQQNQARIGQEMAKVERGLDALQEALRGDTPGQPVFGMPGIATACALGWLELRFGAEYLFARRPAMAAWWALAQARPSMQATQPVPDAR